MDRKLQLLTMQLRFHQIRVANKPLMKSELTHLLDYIDVHETLPTTISPITATLIYDAAKSGQEQVTELIHPHGPDSFNDDPQLHEELDVYYNWKLYARQYMMK